MESQSTESDRRPKDAMELKEGEAAGVAEPSPASENKSVVISMQSEKEEQLKEEEEEESSHRLQIGQGLRAAVLGANDGLVTTASLMMGVSAVNPKAMILSGLAVLVAGALSMAIGEFVSVQTQRDVEISILKKTKMKKDGKAAQKPDSSSLKSPSGETQEKEKALSITSSEKAALPNPLLAACASAMAFSVGAFLPLISAAFIEDNNIRVGVVAGVSSLALFTFGVVGAYFGRASLVKGGLRVLIGGWIAMSATYGVLKLFNMTEVEDVI